MAHQIADHKGIKDFYTLYQLDLANARPKIELELSERLVVIIEGFSVTAVMKSRLLM